MRGNADLSKFKPKDIILDYSKVRADPLNPLVDPFIKRYAGRVYYDPWVGLDLTPNAWLKNNRAIERAIWTYATSSQTVPTIFPTYLDPTYTYVVPSDAPAYAALPRKASLGTQENYVRITALGGAGGSYWVAETETPVYTSPTPARVNIDKVICELWGGVSGFQQAGGGNFKDMLAEAHRAVLLDMLTNGLENGVLNGSGTAPEPKGILTWQGTTNGVDMSHAAVTLAKIREAIRGAWNAGGDLESFGFAITDYVTYDYVKGLLQDYLGYVNIENYELPWGIKTYEIDGIPFIRSRKMPTAENEKKIMFVDRRYTYVAMLQDVTTELYGKTEDAQKFAIKTYLQVICRAPEFQATVYGIH